MTQTEIPNRCLHHMDGLYDCYDRILEDLGLAAKHARSLNSIARDLEAATGFGLTHLQVTEDITRILQKLKTQLECKDDLRANLKAHGYTFKGASRPERGLS